MRILIVEDEAPAARRLQKLVGEIEPAASIVGHTESIEATSKWLNENEAPDLLLMDIQLADGISFEIFNRHEIPTPVIFTTAYDEFAIRAFKVNSIDYLLKPIDKNELARSIEKFKARTLAPGPQDLFRQLVEGLAQGKPVYKNRFLVSKGAELLPIDSAHIAFFHTEDRVVFLHTHDSRRYIIEHTLDELESLVDPAGFCRANRQFIVSLKSVRAVQLGFNGKLKASLHPAPPEEVVVSREKATAFKTWLGNS